MDIKSLEQILGDNFIEIISTLKNKYKENNERIKKLEVEKEKLKSKIKSTYISYGLDNCVDNLEEIEKLNDNLIEISEVTLANKNINDRIKSYNKKIEEVKRINPVNNELIEEYTGYIENAKTDIIHNKNIIKPYGTKKEINAKIEDLYNAIDQSMIIFEKEERLQKDAEISRIYVEIYGIDKTIDELKKNNKKIEKELEKSEFNLENIEKIDINEEQKQEEKIETLDIDNDVIKEEPTIVESNIEPETLIIEENPTENNEINVIDIKEPTKAVQPLEIDNEEIINTEIPEEFRKYKPANINRDDYKTAIIEEAQPVDENLNYKEKLKKLAEEGPLTKKYIDYELDKINREKNYVKVQPVNKQNDKITVDALLMDYFDMSESQIKEYYGNREKVMELLAEYFKEEPTEDLLMPEDKVIEKIADKLNMSVKDLNKLSIESINAVMRQIKEDKEKDNLSINSYMIKLISKLSPNLSEKLLQRAKSNETVVVAGSLEEELIDEESKGSR